MIVVDASVVANALGDDGTDGDLARRALRQFDAPLHAPELVDVETVSVLRRRWLDGSVTARRFEQAVGDLVDLPLTRVPLAPLMRRAFELRANVTPYDACYVALAEATGAPLLTADARLARAPGIDCHVEVIGSPA